MTVYDPFRMRRLKSRPSEGYNSALYGGGGSFSPLDFPTGLQAYHNVLEMSTVFNNGDQVTLVDDLSGNGKHLTNAGTGTSGPLWDADYGDGLPAINCDGTRLFVCQTGKADWNFMHQGDSTAMFLVRSNEDDETMYLFSSATYGNNAGRSIIFRIQSAGLNGSMESRIRDAAEVYSPLVLPTESAPKDQWLLIWCVAGPTTQKIIINGVVKGESLKTGSYGTTDSQRLPRMFSDQVGASPLKGSYRASAFWNIALDLEIIQKISGGSFLF